MKEANMITLEQAINIGKYNVSGGSEYLWRCFGPDVRYLDFNVPGINKHYGLLFDTKTQTVYRASVGDEHSNYCIIHPEYIEAYEYECASRGVEPYTAYDEECYTNLLAVDDFVEKASAIIEGREHDTRIMLELKLKDIELLALCLDAHSKDITLNQLMEQIIEAAIESSCHES